MPIRVVLCNCNIMTGAGGGGLDDHRTKQPAKAQREAVAIRDAVQQEPPQLRLREVSAVIRGATAINWVARLFVDSVASKAYKWVVVVSETHRKMWYPSDFQSERFGHT